MRELTRGKLKKDLVAIFCIYRCPSSNFIGSTQLYFFLFAWLLRASGCLFMLSQCPRHALDFAVKANSKRFCVQEEMDRMSSLLLRNAYG